MWDLDVLEARVVPATIPVTSLADAGAGSLRAAIEQANLDPALDTITFDPSVRGTITLETELPALSTEVDIEGPGAGALAVARDGANGTPAFRIFTAPAGSVVTVAGLTLTGGLSLPVGGRNASPGIFSAAGGGIANSGRMVISECKITNNVAGQVGTSGIEAYGGGVFNSGTLTVRDSTISDNRAETAYSTPPFAIAIYGNGGGVYNSGTLSLAHVVVRDNNGIPVSSLATNGTVTAFSSTFDSYIQIVRGEGNFISQGHNVFDFAAAPTGINVFALDPTDVLTVTPPGANLPPVVTSLVRTGVHRQPTGLVITFSTSLDPATATDVHNYTIVRVGPHGRSRAHAAPVSVKSATYDAGAFTVTINPRRRLNLHGYYSLDVRAAAPGGVTSSAGVSLDGGQTGQPGTDYKAVIHRFGPVKRRP